MIVWRKSSYSGESNSPDCVELARLDGMVGLRDSKHPGGGHLTLDGMRFSAFVRRAKSGQLDR
jgi:hypothetical protein